MILHVTVKQKIATYQKRDGDIVCGNGDYQVKFTFDEEWAAYDTKTARFTWNGAFFDKDFTGDTCDVPAIYNALECTVGVFAGDPDSPDIRTTTEAVIGCKKSARCGGAAPATENNQYYANEAKQAAENAAADTIAEINQRIADGGIDTGTRIWRTTGAITDFYKTVDYQLTPGDLIPIEGKVVGVGDLIFDDYGWYLVVEELGYSADEEPISIFSRSAYNLNGKDAVNGSTIWLTHLALNTLTASQYGIITLVKGNWIPLNGYSFKAGDIVTDGKYYATVSGWTGDATNPDSVYLSEPSTLGGENVVQTTGNSTHKVMSQKATTEAIKDITNAGFVEKFDGEFVKYFVNNGVWGQNSDARSAIVEATSGTIYKISAVGRFNRFRIYGANTIENGTTLTLIYQGDTGSLDAITEVMQYTFTNTNGYRYIMVFVDYGTTDFSCDLSVAECYGDATEPFKVNGIEVARPEDVTEAVETMENTVVATENRMVEALKGITNFGTFERFDGEFATYYVNNGVWTQNSSSHSAIVEATKDSVYEISAAGTFNRFRVYGANTIESETKPTLIYQGDTGSLDAITEVMQYTFTNTDGYRYIMVFVDFGTTDFSCDLSVAEYYGDATEPFKVNGIEVARPEDVTEAVETMENTVVATENRMVEAIENLENTYFSCNNLFDGQNVLYDQVLDWSNGVTLYATPNMCVSDYIPVKPNTKYICTYWYSMAFYDKNKQYVSGIRPAECEGTEKVITTPDNVHYLRFNSHYVTYPEIQMNEGEVLLEYDDGIPRLKEEYLPNQAVQDQDIPENKYRLECETMRLATTLGGSASPLIMLAAKSIYKDGTPPEYDTFLFYNKADNSLYFSDAQMSSLVKLCEWKTDLAGGLNPENYLATITADGDIIFLRQFFRENPIIYPNGNFENPVVIDFGDSLKPYGFLTSVSVVHFDDGSFVFGDYTTHKLTDETNNDPRNIWRVTKPYTNVSNWTVAHRFKHVYFESEPSDEPDNEIGHIHTIAYDFYANTLYCSTGDIDRHCRVYKSKDKGITWEHVVTGAANDSLIITGEGQKYRSVGMVFTKDGCYYGTDSFFARHNLWKAPRGEDGEADFINIQKICSLEPVNRSTECSQATYGTILMRNPNGLLFLDRAEPRMDYLLDIPFYSFDDEKLYFVATFEKVIFGLEVDSRNGFCNQAFTDYQPTTLGYAVCGGGSVIRPNQCGLLNNSRDNYIGCIKMRIV